LLTIVFVPLAVGFVLLFLPNKLKAVFQKLTLVIAALTFVLSIWIFAGRPEDFSLRVFQIGDFRLEMLLTATALGSFMLLFAAGFGLLIAIYSLKAVGDTGSSNLYFGSLLMTIGGSAGILLSGHLLFLLIFWEIVTASLYLLITTGGGKTSFAATKTFAMIGASDAAFMLGVFMVWTLAGNSFIMWQISLPTAGAMPIIAFLLLMTAAITKAGAMPLHTWLPTSGEVAPTPVMALLPAAIDKLLGIYLLVIIVRELFVLESPALGVLLAIIGAATIIIAVMLAMVQHNLKKLLSYHAVSQVGYMILGIATMTPVGVAGAVFHMLNNAVYKCCLFLCGGAAEKEAGTAELDRLGGLGKKMPFTFAACLIAALSISGIPPLNGFVSKWMVYQGVIEMGSAQTTVAAKLWPVWLVAAVFGSALTLASFVKVIHSVFLSRLPDDLKEAKESPISMTAPMLVLAGLCVFFGVFYHVPLKLFILPGLGIEAGAEIFTGTWASGLATIMIVVGILIGLLILFIGLMEKKVRVVPTWTCGEKQTNEQMTVPGTHFYKTVSSMGGLRQLYSGQDKGYFDPYDQTAKVAMGLTNFLRWLHCGVLPVYLTWMTIGLVIVLFVVCDIW
jgi:formate hydrogenlyase subunit 3/multisubunit Na+/H+ antiporter MnhD subunit